jgi:hypothetical protein
LIRRNGARTMQLPRFPDGAAESAPNEQTILGSFLFKKESPSFLKKRSKKLLVVGGYWMGKGPGGVK